MIDAEGYARETLGRMLDGAAADVLLAAGILPSSMARI